MVAQKGAVQRRLQGGCQDEPGAAKPKSGPGRGHGVSRQVQGDVSVAKVAGKWASAEAAKAGLSPKDRVDCVVKAAQARRACVGPCCSLVLSRAFSGPCERVWPRAFEDCGCHARCRHRRGQEHADPTGPGRAQATARDWTSAATCALDSRSSGTTSEDQESAAIPSSPFLRRALSS